MDPSRTKDTCFGSLDRAASDSHGLDGLLQGPWFKGVYLRRKNRGERPVQPVRERKESAKSNGRERTNRLRVRSEGLNADRGREGGDRTLMIRRLGKLGESSGNSKSKWHARRRSTVRRDNRDDPHGLAYPPVGKCPRMRDECTKVWVARLATTSVRIIKGM